MSDEGALLDLTGDVGLPGGVFGQDACQRHQISVIQVVRARLSGERSGAHSDSDHLVCAGRAEDVT
ncbi:hypothetical protein [Streptomyces sp. NBC_00568]|uniref:hypothetical protein n=1 Tax=Streptomyces sp. NBC_00568 TaxID=2975779 RepID=UPI00225C26D6|nr:hypothetical protein [Streptomyces sp. NBC_00568]MCX4993500.1 hypothetical protein [Streptomyces sp. NBC_00568]